VILPVVPFGRGLGARLRGWRAIVHHVRATRADIWVLHTPELLWLGLWLKWVRRDAVIYDVHEDYAANLAAGGYPVLAKVFRWVERFAARQFDAICYAEVCYQNMLQVPDAKVFMLPNAFEPPTEAPPLPEGLVAGQYWLYTGTLAADWGVFAALTTWASTYRLHQMPLVMAGHSQKSSTIEQLEFAIAALEIPLREQVWLLGGRDYVPHPLIVTLIQHCYAGFGLYIPLFYLKNKIFTKYHEFCALGRPLIYTDSPAWRAWGEAHALGVAYTEAMSPAALMEALRIWQPGVCRDDCFWAYHSGRLEALLAAAGA
jgi:hypothetical protein